MKMTILGISEIIENHSYKITSDNIKEIFENV